VTVVACVVEGHGEVQALPVLVRRLALAARPDARVIVPRPFRLPRGRFKAKGDLERAVAVVAQRVDRGGVLVLADADDDCPVELADELRGRLAGRVSCPVAVVLAVREYGAWFLASMSSLRNHPDVSSDAQDTDAPEQVRDAKGELSRRLSVPKYSETRHQPAFSQHMDLDQASTCRSFRKLRAEVERLMRA